MLRARVRAVAWACNMPCVVRICRRLSRMSAHRANSASGASRRRAPRVPTATCRKKRLPHVRGPAARATIAPRVARAPTRRRAGTSPCSVAAARRRRRPLRRGTSRRVARTTGRHARDSRAARPASTAWVACGSRAPLVRTARRRGCSRRRAAACAARGTSVPRALAPAPRCCARPAFSARAAS